MISEETGGDVLGRLAQIGIVPVVEIADADRAVPLAEALAAGGLPVVEVTFRTSAAVESLRRIAKEVPQVLLMAGTVTSTEQVDLAETRGRRSSSRRG
jgi:2-dehydro-3-deoxyphosphogluconate aldolase/(4S)-4-hydroxy-2-oxoglutarate aldolase